MGVDTPASAARLMMPASEASGTASQDEAKREMEPTKAKAIAARIRDEDNNIDVIIPPTPTIWNAREIVGSQKKLAKTKSARPRPTSATAIALDTRNALMRMSLP